MITPVVIFWFRRDLRIADNRGLSEALKSGYPVQPLFIFDTNILNDLEDKQDRRVEFIHQALQSIQQSLGLSGATLDVRIGDPLDLFKTLLSEYKVKAVYANHDYEPYALKRDLEIADFLKLNHIEFESYKDCFLFSLVFSLSMILFN